MEILYFFVSFEVMQFSKINKFPIIDKILSQNQHKFICDEISIPVVEGHNKSL